ncbi:GNAT family N-acetyltransferase [Terrilactibacillus laevilacticus]|uniref:GNAT family N-acetyltransferase n=1 Tax=Terrilactibacillus laevilacticus TaxID=1380157 RepID=UPI001FE4F1B2|nr:GNAT family N-acetyltransferase [Terrilactibacillus laevilacticus]
MKTWLFLMGEKTLNELNYIKDYKNEENLRKSYNELATMVFGINFEDWYQKGFWSNRYIPFSYIDGGKVVANVSVNVLDLIIKGEKKRALQIGTVMTHPDYRNRGLSASLMNKVLDEYKDNYDFMYLFANQSVLNFYPKFGFKLVNEYQFSMDFLSGNSDRTGIRKLNGNNAEDINFIYKFATERVPVSEHFGTGNAQGILMFYCLYVFYNDIYYLEQEDVIVICKKEDKQMDIFDILSKKEIDIDEILTKITCEDTKKIVFHYTPDYKGIHTKSDIFNGSEVLFVRTNGYNHFPLQIKHPLTSQA